ncbi:MAG TPA: hypothetical protein VIP09_16035 [Dehalococcoidia bacterium]|jgi:hypothetical protein
MTFDFRSQLSKGEAAERLLDEYFSDRYRIFPVDRAAQRSGRDRLFFERDSGERTFVEYKTDWRAQETGNVFVETVSVDTENKAGWAHTCTADLLFYYVPGRGYEVVYVIEPALLRAELERWSHLYPTRAVQNEGYKTHGLLVPLAEFERLAREVVSL